MFNWFKSLVTAREAPPVPAAAAPMPVASPAPPLYFLDVDNDDRLFLRLAHVTSSVHAPSVWARGLQPLREVRASLLAYLALVFPGEDAESLLAMIVNDANWVRSGLAIQRLQAEAAGQATPSLLPLGSHGYLRSAASNAVHDGGEVFRAARQTVNQLRSTSVAPPYPDAVPTVFVVRHYLQGNPPDLLLAGTDQFGVSLREAVASGFNGDSWCAYGVDVEVTVTSPYLPAHIEGEFLLDDYLQRRTGKASPAAIAVATAMLANAPTRCGAGSGADQDR